MENFTTTKIQIGQLIGSQNWATWKYKVSIMLRGTEGAMEAAEGKLRKPVLGAGDGALMAYNAELLKYRKTDSNALLIITSNMTEENLMKVMRFETANEVWQELHRLFDGQSEDRAYTLCMQFFSFKNNSKDDASTMMSKLKNIWNNLNAEILKTDPNMKLPEMFLICKILDSLNEKFFSFKSSWMLLNKQDRTIESLTAQLCGYERALGGHIDETQEVLASTSKVQQKSQIRDENIRCRYCSKIGHRIKNCKQWINDGRPKKPAQSSSKQQQVQNITLMIYTCSEESNRENWYVDNGATTHVTNRGDIFTYFEDFGSNHTVTTADGTVIPAKGKGSVVVQTKVNGKTMNLTLSDVWYVPKITKNLLSMLAAQDKLQNSKFISTTKECRLELNGQILAVGNRKQSGGLYKLQMKTVQPNKPVEINAVSPSSLLQLYHERFGHQNKKYIKDLVKRELGINLNDIDDIQCEGCIYGKAHRLKFGKRERASMPGELVHADVCGPFPESYSKCRYFVLLKDDFSAFRHVYFIRNKSEVKDKIIQFLKEAKNAGHAVKTLLSDNGGEFDNKAVREVLNRQGIIQRLTMPYTPEQNGCAERENRTLVETARSYMHAGDEFPQALWAELINTAAYVLNRTGPTREEGKVPYELWHKKKPKISHLRVIGSECFFHIPKQKRKKLNKKATKGRLIGYDNDDGYRIWNGKQTERSRDVTFCPTMELRIPMALGPGPQEDVDLPVSGEIEEDSDLIGQETEGVILAQDDCPQHEASPVRQSVQLEGEQESEIIENENAFSDCETEEFVDAIPPDVEMPMNSENDVTIPDVPRYNLRDRSTLRPPQKLDDFELFLVDSIIEREPSTYKEAVSSSTSKDRWLEAMKNELDSLQKFKVWDLQNLPRDRKALPCKWVYKVKSNPDGTVEKYKARLVVKGFRQKKGFDFNETFSPVARLATVRSLLSVAAREKLHLIQFDVATAFLNGVLNEDIYMMQPEGFEDGTSRVCHLKKSLYGLKQAPRCWNYCFSETLNSLGFKSSDADPCLYVNNMGDKKILIALYVDDGLVAASDKNLANEFINDLKKILLITTKPASYYLGLEIEQMEDDSIFIKQEAYARKVLERFNMKDCNPVSTPLQKEGIIEKGKVENESQSFPYREAVGSLAYLMVGTRPDLAYAVGVASRSLEKPAYGDWCMVKRIMRYLKGTLSRGIKYVHDVDSPNQIKAYSDADHAGCLKTGRSTTGVLTLYSKGAISWISQRQASVAISTTEAELVAASEAARELFWLKRLFIDLNGQKEIPVLFVDNEAAVKLAHNPEFHRRTKHVRVRHFFVRELVLQNDIVVERTSSATQLADLLTKALPRPRLQELCQNLGLKDQKVD